MGWGAFAWSLELSTYLVLEYEVLRINVNNVQGCEVHKSVRVLMRNLFIQFQQRYEGNY